VGLLYLSLRDLRLVAVVGRVELCRIGLTYGEHRLSAMLGDVSLDVGKTVFKRFSTSTYDIVALSTRIDGLKLKVSNMLRMRLIRAFS
jgi:hypothetical protein